jgi:hypothetical protein
MKKSTAVLLVGTVGIGGIVAASMLHKDTGESGGISLAVGISMADSNNQPVLVNDGGTAFVINEGETYTASVVLQNNSTRGGQPYAVQVEVNATAGGASGTFLSPTTKPANLYAGGSTIVNFPISPQLGSGPDTGTFVVNVKDPQGNILVTRSVNLIVNAVIINPAAVVTLNNFTIDEGKTTPITFNVENKSTRGNEYWSRSFIVAVVAAANNTGTLVNQTYEASTIGANQSMDFIFNLSPAWDTGGDSSGIVSIVVKDTETGSTVSNKTVGFTINAVPVIYNVVIDNIS